MSILPVECFQSVCLVGSHVATVGWSEEVCLKSVSFGKAVQENLCVLIKEDLKKAAF